MERKRELFSPSKDKAGFWKITGTITFAFIYLLTEIILWFALKDNVFNQVFLGQMLFICCNVILLLGLGLYLWLPPKQGKNIESLLPAIRPYHHICDSLQDEILLDHILAQLLKGKYSSLDYEEYFENNRQIDFNKDYRIVIFIPESEAGNITSAFQICNSSFLAIAQEELEIYMLEVDNVLAGICLSRQDSGFDKENSWLSMSRYMQYAQVKVEENTGVHLFAAAGGRHSGLAGLKSGFSEAWEAYEYQKIYDDENSLIFYNNIEFSGNDDYKNNDDAWYELERKFLHYINIEDFENSAKALEKIIELIGNTPHQSFQITKYKVFGLLNSLYINSMERKDVAESLLNINALYHISGSKSITELQRWVKIIYKAIESALSADKNSLGSNSRAQEIASYLQENYSNTDLNIVAVADKFRLTPAYLSRLFKKEMGRGPAEYLQKIRIEAAKNLLVNTDMTIKEISEKVGYQYVLTLNRAFKKFEGITPSQYLARHKNIN